MEDRATLIRSASTAPANREQHDDGSDPARETAKTFVLDTNVLIHDPNSLLNFEEHEVVIPMTVLEELDRLKSGKAHTAADCRAAIRLIDRVLGEATPEEVENGVPIQRGGAVPPEGTLAVMMPRPMDDGDGLLPDNLNDNRIINDIVSLQQRGSHRRHVLVSNDINMRLKARACGVEAEDYHTDQLVSDIGQLTRGYFQLDGSFWERIHEVDTRQHGPETLHYLSREELVRDVRGGEVFPNQYILDEPGFAGRILQ